MNKSHFNQYFTRLKDLVTSLEKEESLRKIYRKERKLYELFDFKLTKKKQLKDISYQERLAFFEAYYLWNLFYSTVGGSKNTISNIELKTYPYFYAHKPLVKKHKLVSESLRKKFNILEDDYKKLKSKSRKIQENIKARKKINNSIRKRLITNGQLDNHKVYNVFKKLFPYCPLKEGEVRCILTDLSIFFVVPDFEKLKRRNSFKERSGEIKKEIKNFYQLIQKFHFKYFENFPTFSIFDINEVSDNFVKELIKETGLEENQFKFLVNSQTMIHIEHLIEQYMIHDTWGHVWQAELAQGKVFYDELANRKVPFFPEMTLRIDQNIVSYSDIFYINFKGELSFDESLAKDFISQYFKNSQKIHFHATMSEMCAEITEYLFVFDYGNKIPLSSSSKFNHNPTKFDFAWSDVNYFSKVLNTPYSSLLKNKSEFNLLNKKLEVLLSKKYKQRFQNIKSLRSFRSQLKKMNQKFLELFKTEFEKSFEQPLNVTRNRDEHYVLKMFFQVLKTQSVVNYIFSDFFGNTGSKKSQYRLVVLVYIYLLFESDPAHNFWELDIMLKNNLLTLLDEL